MTNKEVGIRIVEARERCGFKRNDLAKRIGVSPSTITRYEKGEFNRIKLAIVEAIANATNTNPVWIMGNSDQMVLPNKVKAADDISFSSVLSSEESSLLNSFRTLNSDGRDEAHAHMAYLCSQDRYRKDIESLKDSGTA